MRNIGHKTDGVCIQGGVPAGVGVVAIGCEYQLSEDSARRAQVRRYVDASGIRNAGKRKWVWPWYRQLNVILPPTREPTICCD